MSRRIAVLQGHPDPAGGHEVRRIDVARLEFCGVAPVRATVIGMVEGRKEARAGWLTRLSALGAQGS
ncbi:MAG TPA: hypothetical protein VFU24_16585 [Burkholderiales bacterium]|nr:hypothetical protein [Burkholderiales bacterium]